MLKAFIAPTILLAFIPAAHAGEYLGEWRITRYYTPVAGQAHYFNGWKGDDRTCKTANLYYIGAGSRDPGSYTADLCMQSSGDPFITADGTNLRHEEPGRVVACPRAYLGRTLHIENIGYVHCHDVGGAIKGKRLDVWTGIGEAGYDRMSTTPSGLLDVSLLTSSWSSASPSSAAVVFGGSLATRQSSSPRCSITCRR